MENNTKLYNIAIKRDDKLTEFEIELTPDSTILDALEQIRFNIDSSLTYRHSCHHGSCGTCACLINGTEKLACMTFLSEFENNKITIEALNSFKIISDLVVDISQMISQMPITNYLRDSEVSQESIKPNGIFSWKRFENCIECGSCYSACPVVDNSFIGPASLAAINNELKKEIHSTEKETLKTLAYSKNGVEKCEEHYACSRVCPTKVYPGKHINELRKNK
ncbi:MAG: succinate dehydrogenase/fumarate reductase iron-sulfur subunit [Pleomorphochaeta sp.]